jgi:hypothetical protein
MRRLEEYWGIGPKTRDLLADELGVEDAIEAVEAGDVRALTDAGIPRGRATRILRHAHGGEAMDLLATRDARDVYKRTLDIIGTFALTETAADRIRILTPLPDEAAMGQRLDDVATGRETWDRLDESDRDAVTDIFAEYDSVTGGERSAVRTALRLREEGFTEGVFSPLATLDTETLSAATAALAGLAGGDDRIGEGADSQLDTLRAQLGSVEDMSATPESVLKTVQSGARGTEELRDVFARHVADEGGVDAARVREAMPSEAPDASGFVVETLRSLADDLRTAAEKREAAVREELRDVLDDAAEDVDAAVTAVDDIALSLSLARFATAFDLTRPAFVGDRRHRGPKPLSRRRE